MTDWDVRPFLEAADRGLNWIVEQQKLDGSFCRPEDGIGGYYKVPYALSLAGYPREAHRLLSWVAEHHFTADGDFRAPQRKARGTTHDDWPAYGNAWLILGSHRVGRWDLSRRGIAFLLRGQMPIGRFCALEDNAHFLEPVCTSWGGLAALATGHSEAALLAGDLLTALAKSQPDPDRFYYRMDIEGNLLTDVPDGKELFYFVDAIRCGQIYYNPGIALIFLAHLYLATGEARYLDAGKTLFDFTQRCAADVYRFPPSGKLGYGAALLYALTGDPRARRAARDVGAYLMETQTGEGFWRLPDVAVYQAIEEKDDFEIRLDITAEFSIFLMEIAALI